MRSTMELAVESSGQIVASFDFDRDYCGDQHLQSNCVEVVIHQTSVRDPPLYVHYKSYLEDAPQANFHDI